MSKLNNESLLEGAECAKLPPKKADHLFFQIDPNTPNQDLKGVRKTEAADAAIDICRKCPVLTQCLEYALRHPESAAYGIWGGTTDAQRRRILRLGEKAINKAMEFGEAHLAAQHRRILQSGENAINKAIESAGK